MTTIYANGVRTDGQYGLVVDASELDPLIAAERQAALAAETEPPPRPGTLGPPPYINPRDLAQAGWGVIWPPEPLTAAEEAHRQALAPLIEHRRRQIDPGDTGQQGPFHFHHQDGWTMRSFLYEEARGVRPGNMQVDIVPYYLCIVASPARIPWDFQLSLSSEYAVGRLWFDEPGDCGRYVGRLLAYENQGAPLPNAREALFVAVEKPGDATYLSAMGLVQPLYDWLATRPDLDFSPSLLLGDEPGAEASKAHLLNRLAGKDLAGAAGAPPALLFTASHGLEYGQPSEDQYLDQGALLLQDWPQGEPVLGGHRLAATDVSDDLQLAGMLAFCFACFGAGTPLHQDWVRPTAYQQPEEIALKPFVARLPQKMLAGGLVAFVGHVSRAWATSFLPGDQTGTFQAALHELLSGAPVGHSLDYLNKSWVGLNLGLNEWFSGALARTPAEVRSDWLTRNDLRGYAILGDPAARLRVELL
jgi:hypothetical protein